MRVLPETADVASDMRRAQGRWRVQWGPMLRMVVLLALGAMLVVKVVSGGVLLYVNAIYIGLILAAGLAMIAIGYVAGLEWLVRREVRPARHLQFNDGDHLHATRRAEAISFALLAVPLIVGLLVPARPLGAAAVEGRGNDAAALGGRLRSIDTLGQDTTRWTLLDWTAALAQAPDPRILAGKPVSLVGFVSSAGDEGFTVSRFIVICCTADGNVASLPVRGGGTFPRDTWVQVRGTLALTGGNKGDPYVVATQVEKIAQPGQPYLYP